MRRGRSNSANFRHYAKRVHKFNVPRLQSRGGIRL